MIVTRAERVTLRGARAACEVLREHPFTLLREGTYLGLDLRVDICPYCGAVCVRDVSIDRAAAGVVVPLARGGARRRDHVLGWYTGKRRAGREFK